MGTNWCRVAQEWFGLPQQVRSEYLQYMIRVFDIYAYRWRLLDRKNMTLDCAYEQSNSSPQGASTGRTELPLLSHNLWHSSQTAGFSGHMPTTLECSDHRMGVPSSTQMFQFASSSLSFALSPSVSSSNATPMHLQLDGAPSYLTGNCGSPAINPGNTPMDIDYDNVDQDHHPVDPDRGVTVTITDVPSNPVRAHSPIRFSVPPNSSNDHPLADGSIPNNPYSHANVPSIEVEVPYVTSTPPVSVPQILSAHDEAIAHCVPVSSIPETLILEEATTPVSSSRSESATSAKPKRGKSGINYKLSSSLPVTLE